MRFSAAFSDQESDPSDNQTVFFTILILDYSNYPKTGHPNTGLFRVWFSDIFPSF